MLSRALVTGCAGFIGSHLTEDLLRDGVAVLGVDCFNENYARQQKLRNLERAREWDGFDFVPVDLARGDLVDLVADSDVIFHLAAEPGVRSSWGDRFEHYVRNNVIATQHLLEASRAVAGRRFVFASSSSIYGDAEALPTPEDVTPKPVSPYGVTKLAGEQLCRAYHLNWAVEAVCLRYFSVYGPRQRPDMAFTRFCRAAIRDEPITVYGDGRQTRDFTYVEDIVRATRAAAESDSAVGGVYNIAAGNQRSVNDALAVIESCAGRRLTVDRLPPEKGDVGNTSAATELARRDLSFEPISSWEDGLTAQFAWALDVERTEGVRSSSLRPLEP